MKTIKYDIEYFDELKPRERVLYIDDLQYNIQNTINLYLGRIDEEQKCPFMKKMSKNECKFIERKIKRDIRLLKKLRKKYPLYF